MFEPVQSSGSTVDAIVQQIQHLLEKKALRPGDLLPNEAELAEQMHVSRSSVREAVKVLSALGVVEIRRGNGTYISREIGKSVLDPLMLQLLMSDGDTEQLMDFREMMERMVIAACVRSARDEECMRLAEIAAQMQDQAGTAGAAAERLAELDLAFHHALAATAHNIYMEKLYCFILDFFRPYIVETYKKRGNIDTACAVHTQIADAVQRREESAAAAAARRSAQEWCRAYGSAE